MTLDKYVKASDERKRYQIDYHDWLDTGESVSTAVFVILSNAATPLLVIDGIGILPSKTAVQYYVSGGVLGATYKVLVTIVTDGGQTKEDDILFRLVAP